MSLEDRAEELAARRASTLAPRRGVSQAHLALPVFEEDYMSTERIRPIEDPGFLLSGAYAIGRRIFGDVPTPQKVMAHHPALMLGIGALWTSIERFALLDGRLRALLQLHVATLYDVPY